MPDIRITLLLVVSTLLVFALPSWAWGNVRGLLAHPARAGTILVAAVGVIAFLFSGMDFTSLKCDDRRTRVVIPASIAIMAPLLFLPVYADHRDIYGVRRRSGPLPGLGGLRRRLRVANRADVHAEIPFSTSECLA
jgi:hypothetical protein